MDKVYYVSLPEQLDQILEQLKINCADLTHCMEWVGKCEKATLSVAQAVDQQLQVIQNIRENTQTDVCQELQHQCAHILQDVQFQLNLLVETFEQNHIIHIHQQEVECQAQCLHLNCYHINDACSPISNTGIDGQDKISFGITSGSKCNQAHCHHHMNLLCQTWKNRSG